MLEGHSIHADGDVKSWAGVCGVRVAFPARSRLRARGALGGHMHVESSALLDVDGYNVVSDRCADGQRCRITQ